MSANARLSLPSVTIHYQKVALGPMDQLRDRRESAWNRPSPPRRPSADLNGHRDAPLAVNFHSG
jgi:hypothetical protein